MVNVHCEWKSAIKREGLFFLFLSTAVWERECCSWGTPAVLPQRLLAEATSLGVAQAPKVGA